MRRGFQPSTLAERAWQRTRGAVLRWAGAGAVVGGLIALVAFAPAAWLAGALASASDGRVLLAHARGTVWQGSALPVLTGGADSRDAASLPDRLAWSLAWRGTSLVLRLAQPCCIEGTQVVHLRPRFGGLTATLEAPPAGTVGQWPAAWLAGLGTPWNTLQPGGWLRLATPGLTLQSVQGRWRLDGAAVLDIVDLSSRLSTLPVLGSYRLRVQGGNAGGGALELDTLDGALLLDGRGELGPSGVRFRGEARAAPGREAALDNLLNIIGRRQGAAALIAIG